MATPTPKYADYYETWKRLYLEEDLQPPAIAEHCSSGAHAKTIRRALKRMGVWRDWKPREPSKTPAERLWGMVKTGAPDECWNFQGYRDRGYGRVFMPGGGYILAHRLAYEDATGRDPGPLLVCHRCDNPSCCNPNHLYAGTPQDNMRDQIERNRRPTVLDEETVYTLRCLHFCDPGATCEELVEDLQLEAANRTVSQAISGKSWPHVPFPDPDERSPYVTTSSGTPSYSAPSST